MSCFHPNSFFSLISPQHFTIKIPIFAENKWQFTHFCWVETAKQFHLMFSCLDIHFSHYSFNCNNNKQKPSIGTGHRTIIALYHQLSWFVNKKINNPTPANQRGFVISVSSLIPMAHRHSRAHTYTHIHTFTHTVFLFSVPARTL